MIVQDGTVYPIEIKKTSQPGQDTVRHFSVLEKLGMTIGRGAIICMVNEQLPITVDVDAVPAWQVA